MNNGKAIEYKLLGDNMAKKAKEKIKPSFFSRCLSKILVLTVITLVALITLKSNADLRNAVYKKVFQNNMSFAKINEVYKKYFGSSLPLADNVTADTQLVSAEKIEYSDISKYKDGAKLTVKENYVVPTMDSGLIIFAGKKDDYGNTIIVQRPDNVEVWYANLKEVNVSLYDYIKKGEILGETEGKTLYMVFTKEGKALDYQKYI